MEFQIIVKINYTPFEKYKNKNLYLYHFSNVFCINNMLMKRYYCRTYSRRSRSQSKERYSSSNYRRSRSPRRRSASTERERVRSHRQGEYKSHSARSPGYEDRKRYMERRKSRSTSRSRLEREKRRSRSPYRFVNVFYLYFILK